jgi:uncharacterized protein
MTAIDLSAVPIVDNHCHAILRQGEPRDLAGWRRLFTEGPGEETARVHVPGMLPYRRIIRQLAAFYGCEPSEDAVLAARQEIPFPSLVRRLFDAANIETLVLDTGFPPPDRGMAPHEMPEATGCRVAPLLRLEILMQSLIPRHYPLVRLIEAFRDALTDVRADGFVGLKSIAAYRTGLNIKKWDTEEVRRSFHEAWRQVTATGSVRIVHKPLLDTLLHVAFEEASRQELPVQFHTGYGDPDLDLLLANPLHLRAVLEEPAYRGMKVVLLHEAYPYTKEAGFLAAVYDTVFLDLSYVIPYIGYRAMLQFTRDAFGVAPLTKLLYASDATWMPEFFYLSAVNGRQILGEVLGESVDDGDLDRAEAERFGERILRRNAVELYNLAPGS